MSEGVCPPEFFIMFTLFAGSHSLKNLESHVTGFMVIHVLFCLGLCGGNHLTTFTRWLTLAYVARKLWSGKVLYGLHATWCHALVSAVCLLSNAQDSETLSCGSSAYSHSREFLATFMSTLLSHFLSHMVPPICTLSSIRQPDGMRLSPCRR